MIKKDKIKIVPISLYFSYEYDAKKEYIKDKEILDNFLLSDSYKLIKNELNSLYDIHNHKDNVYYKQIISFIEENIPPTIKDKFDYNIYINKSQIKKYNENQIHFSYKYPISSLNKWLRDNNYSISI
jgi:hypothetical protein